MDEVGDDEEVAGILHSLDHAEFESEALAVALDRVSGREAMRLDSTLEPCFRFPAQLVGFVDRSAGGGGEARQDRLAQQRAKGAALGNVDRRSERLGQVGELRGHLGARLEMVLRAQLPPVALGDQPALRDADQRIVCLVVLAPGEIGLVGGDERQASRIGKLDERRLGAALGGKAMALQLDIEPVAENVVQPGTAGGGEIGLPGGKGEIERTGGTAGERYEPVGGLGQHRERHVRGLAGRHREERVRGQAHQVAIALLARGEQDEPRAASGPRAAGRSVLVGEVDRERATDDRLDAGARELVGKLERAEHVVGVGQGQGRLPIGLGELGQLGDGQRAFEQRIGRVHMQVHESRTVHGRLPIPVIGMVEAGRAPVHRNSARSTASYFRRADGGRSPRRQWQAFIIARQ